jgi:hypothetical protein
MDSSSDPVVGNAVHHHQCLLHGGHGGAPVALQGDDIGAHDRQ